MAKPAASKNKNVYFSLLFLSPFLILFLLFKLYPMIAGFVLSFTKSNIFGTEFKFVEFSNYFKLFQDTTFWKAMRNTVLYTLLTTPLMIPLALFLAVALNRGFRFLKALRSVFFLPKILSVSVISLIWLWIYQPDWGLLNYYLKMFHLPIQNWLQKPFMALFSIVIMDIWWTAGYQLIILLAGLGQIPKELYEVADIEGANAWQKFIYVTLPCLKPSLLFVFVTHIIGCLQIFGMIYIVTGGGPYGSTRVMVQYIYENAFIYNKMGYASALAYILMVVILVFTLIQFKFLREKE
ncbi:MAG: sugar ABC transporter permease [Spirochaetales bacterium]|nr:sugar ABC transporter permease [Spirochaetales bacterium]